MPSKSKSKKSPIRLGDIFTPPAQSGARASRNAKRKAAAPDTNSDNEQAIPPEADLKQLSPFQKKRYKALDGLRLKQLQNECDKQGASHLKANKASKATIIKRLLHFEDSTFGSMRALSERITQDAQDSNESDTEDKFKLFPAESEFMVLRLDVYKRLIKMGALEKDLQWLKGTVSFPPEGIERAQFISKQTTKIQRYYDSFEARQQSRKRKMCTVCDVDAATSDNGLCDECTTLMGDDNDGIDPKQLQFDHADDRARVQNNGKADVALTRTSRQDTQGNIANTNWHHGDTFGLATSLPDVCARLLPHGVTLETMDIETYRFMVQFDHNVLMSTAARKHVWLHFYRPGTMAERSTKAPSATSASAGSLVIDAETGTVKSAASMRLVTRPIKSSEQLLQCMHNLQRLEQKFRSTDSILRDLQTVSKWCHDFGWEAALTCVEELRQVRMAMGSYDRMGLDKPESQFYHEMVAQAAHTQQQNTRQTPARAYTDRPGTGQRKPLTPTSGQKRGGKVPHNLLDEARANGLCLRFQQGTCKETKDHTVANARGKTGPFTVLHTCVVCKERETHGYANCPHKQ